VPVGDEPSALSYDSLNDYVYCACRGSNEVYVIDAHRDTVVTHIGVGAQPFALAWNPIDLRTYVLNYASAGVSVLRDSLHPGVEEGQPQSTTLKPQATVVRGVLMLGDRGPATGDRAELLDAAGRKVMDLKSGANDVRALAPGVYFVREAQAQAQAQAVQKIVLTR
jgi:YVTN family beta-propeller protein